MESPFRKSTHSLANNNCVEVSSAQDRVFVRDTRDPEKAIRFQRRAWMLYVKRIKDHDRHRESGGSS